MTQQQPVNPNYTTSIPVATAISMANSPHPASIIENSHNHPSNKVIAGAAAVGGVAGMIVSGPIVALAGAAGAAVATMSSGTGGEVARSAGNMGAASYDKAADLNKKHHIVEKVRTASRAAFRVRRWDLLRSSSHCPYFAPLTLLLRSNLTSLPPDQEGWVVCVFFRQAIRRAAQRIGQDQGCCKRFGEAG